MKYTPDNKIFDGNKLVGYVENGTLYGIDRSGYAVEIGNADGAAQAVASLTEWKSCNRKDERS